MRATSNSAKTSAPAVRHRRRSYYRQAFAEFGTRALWNWRQMEHPTITQALAIAASLKTEGDIKARALAIAIEQACRAAL